MDGSFETGAYGVPSKSPRILNIFFRKVNRYLLIFYFIFAGLARCISLSSLGLFVYNELLNESLHAKIKEAIQVYT